MNRKITALIICVCLTLCMTGMDAFAADDSSLAVSEVTIGSQWFHVDGDEGRFREDSYMTDEYTGGIESLIMSGNWGDASLDVNMHAIYDNDFGYDIEIDEEGKYNFSVKGRQMRRYYDGSNEAWDPAPYGLEGQSADREDGHMFIDRYNNEVILGVVLEDLPDITFGYNHFSRDGEETLLRGERARVTGDTIDRNRSIPAWRQVDGASDTFFVQLSDTIAEKHNVSIKQEYETHQDDQRSIFPRYLDGSLEQFRTFEDEPAFDEFLTHASYNSFLNDTTYVTANYLYQNLHNETKRAVIRPGASTEGHSINPLVNNKRKSHISNFGIVLLDGLVKDMKVSASARFESTDTDNEGQVFREGDAIPRTASAEQEETNFAQSLSFVYNGIDKTTLSYLLEKEQGDLNWSQRGDLLYHEVFTDFSGPNSFARETDVDQSDVMHTLQAATRLSNNAKLTAKYKRSDKKRKYTDASDSNQTMYPGVLGSYNEDKNEASVRLSSKIIDNWSGGIEYTFLTSDFGYDFAGQDTQELLRNRVALTATGMINDDLTLNLVGMGEKYTLDTPGNGTAQAKFPNGDDGFEYVNEIYMLGGNASYRIDENTFSYLSYQYTHVSGDIRNQTNEVSLTLNRELDEDSNVEASLDWIMFDDRNKDVEGFDDYVGVGVSLSYNKVF